MSELMRAFYSIQFPINCKVWEYRHICLVNFSKMPACSPDKSPLSLNLLPLLQIVYSVGNLACLTNLGTEYFIHAAWNCFRGGKIYADSPFIQVSFPRNFGPGL